MKYTVPGNSPEIPPPEIPLEVFGKFLPRDFLPDFLKVVGDLPLVVCVFVSFKMLALALDHDQVATGFLLRPY